ncbi:MAG TPA: glutathione S-transferase family protein [Usitatibacter sp.]|nr:glutathione S-transferase family protein [Usitatibacter sp.]
MILIGMLDSPYVRRCAVSMRLMGVAFEHRSLSVFRTYAEFSKVNPVVKAPTLVCDDGTVLMDSTLILDYVESTVAPGKRLMPQAVAERQAALRMVGLALAATDKVVNVIYEKEQRPPERMHQAWVDRAIGQVRAALGEMEPVAAKARGWMGGDRMNAADVMTACMWRFMHLRPYTSLPAGQYPALAALSQRAEALPEFIMFPPDEP